MYVARTRQVTLRTADAGYPKGFQVLAVDKIFSRHLVEALTKIRERPWREARRGGPINELWLAQQLSPFGIHSQTLRIGASVGKGYSLEDFGDAFARNGGELGG